MKPDLPITDCIRGSRRRGRGGGGDHSTITTAITPLVRRRTIGSTARIAFSLCLGSVGTVVVVPGFFVLLHLVANTMATGGGGGAALAVGRSASRFVRRRRGGGAGAKSTVVAASFAPFGAISHSRPTHHIGGRGEEFPGGVARRRTTPAFGSSPFQPTRAEGGNSLSLWPWARSPDVGALYRLHGLAKLPPSSSPGRRWGSTRLQKTRSLSSSASPSVEDGGEDGDEGGGRADEAEGFYADPDVYPTFESLGVTNPILLDRLHNVLGLSRPTVVQARAFRQIQGNDADAAEGGLGDGDEGGAHQSGDVVIGAETGSGKTLAYLLPLIDDILTRKARLGGDEGDSESLSYIGYDYCRAVVLVPNKELANQVVRMASGLCGGLDRCLVWGGTSSGGGGGGSAASSSPSSFASDVVRVAVLPGNLSNPKDFKPFRDSVGLGGRSPPVDILVCTPAALGPWGFSPKNIDFFADVRTLVVDEADMLLDGGFKRPLDDVFMGFRRADRLIDGADGGWGGDVAKTQHVFVGATLPDYGLKSVDAYLAKKFPSAERLIVKGMHNARHSGLRQRTVWIEDDYGDGGDGNVNKVRMGRLVSMLMGDEEDDSLAGEKVMVFLNSVEDVDGATNALRRAGIEAVPYHAKIPLEERSVNLERFRRYVASRDRGTDDKDGGDSVPVLVCTDLASRGLDIPGVTAIVQLQFAGNVVAHLHRMGRCGRAGKRDGRGVIFYGGKERELVDVVREAERQQETMTLEGAEVVDNEDEDGGGGVSGTVAKAFSRRRGFTKKKKKMRRDSLERTSKEQDQRR